MVEQKTKGETFLFLRRVLSEARDEIAAQSDTLFLWFPVFIGVGIGIYFSLPSEPPLVLGIFCLAVSGAVFSILRQGRFEAFAMLFLLVCAGFFSAQLRTHIVHTPILERDIGPTMVEGRVEALEDLGDGEGARIVLSDLVIEDLPAEKTPRKIRLKLRNDDGVKVGQKVKALSKLHRPSVPVMPGAFDFQLYLYFQGIGAVGFIYKDVEVLEKARLSGVWNAIESMRQSVHQRIEDVLPYPEAGFAAALMIGRKTAIERDDQEAMRNAGLAHMLAISGLHVGLFSGALFFLSRFLMACFPRFTLYHPIKKYAAVIAFIGATFYMLMAGASVPTQRALLMAGIAFLAIILDRSPFSLRLVAFAALVILLIFPESLVSAGFQMSFAAVTALIVFYDRLRPVWSRIHQKRGLFRRAGVYVLGMCATTLVASTAIMPFALYHFNQVAFYDLLANLIAGPLMAFVVMPMVVASSLLMPLPDIAGWGADVPALWIMKYGIKGILHTAHWVSDLPYAVFRTPVWSMSALVLIVIAGLILMLWRGRLKWIACIVLFLPLPFALNATQLPDLIIYENPKLIGVRTEGGSLSVSTARTEKFVRENWYRAYGMEGDEPVVWDKMQAETTPHIACDTQGCRFVLKGKRVSVIRDEMAVKEECAWGDIVLAEFPVRNCHVPILIDLYELKDHGTHSLKFENKNIHIERVLDKRGHRPWSSLNVEFSRSF